MICSKFKHMALCATTALALSVPGGVWAQQASQETTSRTGLSEPEPEKKTEIKPAQQTPRSILFPAGEPGPYIPPQSGIPETTGTRPPVEGEGEAESVSGDELVIETMVLTEVEPAAKGLLLPEEGGFPVSFWRGSDRHWIEKWLADLNVATKSPVMARLTERLLLSAVKVPGSSSFKSDAGAPDAEDVIAEQTTAGIGQSGKDNAASFESGRIDASSSTAAPDNRDYLALRIKKISETGNLEHLATFLKMLPPDSYAGSQEISDLMLMAGDISGACQVMRQNMDGGTIAPYWLKLLAYCQAMEGERESAGLTIELLMEKGTLDFVFFDLVNKLSAEKESALREGGAGGQGANAGENAQNRGVLSSGLTRLDPMTYSLLSVLEQPIDAKLFADAPAIVLYALAGNTHVSKEDRFAAAAESYRRATYPVERLIPHYNSMRFTADEIENAVSIAKNDASPLGDVLLYQAAAKQIDGRRKAEILREIWGRALARKDIARAALLNARTVNSLQPSDMLLLDAHHITRALLLAGNDAKAMVWFNFVRSKAYEGNSDATRALMDIWPLMIFSGTESDVPWSQEILDLWWNGQMVLSPDQRTEKAGQFYSVAEAMGFVVPESLWRELTGPWLQESNQPLPVALWRGLISAVAENRRGEAVLLSLMAAGPEALSHLDPTGASALIRTLRALGYETEARHLAIEILANDGF